MKNKDFLIRVGKQLRKNRTSFGISQLELAEKTDLTQSYISEIELGKRDIRIITMNNISNALNLPLSDFFNFDK